jgi:hypothetical protein
MKIIIIILICLFFSLSITPINEFITNQNPNPFDQRTQTAGPSPETQPTNPIQTQTAGQQASSDGSLQSQINMLSTQMQSTNAMALGAKKKSDDITSQIDQIKQELQKQVDT